MGNRFEDRPENKVGFAWGGQLSEALALADVSSLSGSRNQHSSSRPRLKRSETTTRIETTRVTSPDGSTVLRERMVTIQLVHTNKTDEIERLTANGWAFPDSEEVVTVD